MLVQQPSNAWSQMIGPPDDLNAERMAHLNELFERYAAAHPVDTRVLDLASIVCPTGHPCPEQVEGLAPRPRDGAHYSDDGAAWVAAKIYEQLQVVAT